MHRKEREMAQETPFPRPKKSDKIRTRQVFVSATISGMLTGIAIIASILLNIDVYGSVCIVIAVHIVCFAISYKLDVFRTKETVGIQPVKSITPYKTPRP